MIGAGVFVILFVEINSHNAHGLGYIGRNISGASESRLYHMTGIEAIIPAHLMRVENRCAICVNLKADPEYVDDHASQVENYCTDHLPSKAR